METFLSLQMVLVINNLQWITCLLTRTTGCESLNELWNSKWFGDFLFAMFYFVVVVKVTTNVCYKAKFIFDNLGHWNRHEKELAIFWYHLRTFSCKGIFTDISLNKPTLATGGDQLSSINISCLIDCCIFFRISSKFIWWLKTYTVRKMWEPRSNYNRNIT